MNEEKGFFNRLKETLFGNDDDAQDTAQDEKEAEEILKQEEDLLNQIEHDAEAGVQQQQEESKLEEEVAPIDTQIEQKQAPVLGVQKISKEEIEAKPENKPIVEALKTIEDPEIGVDIWTLGLIYHIDFKQEEKSVHILMTFTSVMCPVGPMIVQSVEQKVKVLPNVEKVTVEVTFTPPWEPTDELREMLGV